LGMVPRWWKHRNAATRARKALATPAERDATQPANSPPHGL